MIMIVLDIYELNEYITYATEKSVSYVPVCVYRTGRYEFILSTFPFTPFRVSVNCAKDPIFEIALRIQHQIVGVVLLRS